MWQKRGLIFDPAGKADWFTSHAALPIAEWLQGDEFRVYFSGRDSEGRAQLGYFDVELTPPYRILNICPEPILRYGELGTFDDRGVTASCMVKHEGRIYHYYSGWSLGVTVPFYFFIGAAWADEKDRVFTRISPAPLMDRHKVDPYLLGSPYILIENGLWRMWYISCVKWTFEDNQPKHYYLVKYAESHNGIEWQRNGHICIDFSSEDEYAIARPCVLKDGDLYKMWYSFRGKNYRIGYAESKDGLSWQRKDHLADIGTSESGWDSQMITYPFVFDHNNTRYMLYNGNDYGKSGIGLAQWSQKHPSVLSSGEIP